jgi:hypothetical protein
MSDHAFCRLVAAARSEWFGAEPGRAVGGEAALAEEFLRFIVVRILESVERRLGFVC